MTLRVLSVVGIVIALACLWVATTMYPGGFDWSRGFVSTLLREPAGSARVPAIAGLVLFCLSLAIVFARLARASEFVIVSKPIRIGGIGSMVYAGLAFTPMHDLMVGISLLFFLVAVISLLRVLFIRRDMGFFVSGCFCLAVLVTSAAIYYGGIGSSALPWAQRVSFGLFTAWLVALDCSAYGRHAG